MGEYYKLVSSVGKVKIEGEELKEFLKDKAENERLIETLKNQESVEEQISKIWETINVLKNSAILKPLFKGE
ncbi:MAG: hypothetical protein IJO86_00795 [Oscillospiraceae bacterium]|nr:hypothetical protein [Oscillospiraceae bacterium]